MYRIEQIERRLGAGDSEAAEAAPSQPTAAASSSAPVARSGAGPAAAVAAEPEQEASPEPAGALELEQVQAIWPAVAEAVAEENGMVGAALAAARPLAVEDGRVTVAFPPDAAFVKKKAESNRELIQRALHGLTGHSAGVAFELSEEAAATGPAALGEDELIERLRAEFAAQEIFEDEEQ
jgi:hypothetical protein